jgi:hypothetical protein
MIKTFSMTDLIIIAVLLDEEENNLKNINPKRRIWVHDILKKKISKRITRNIYFCLSSFFNIL